MSRKLTAFYMDPEILDALRRVKEDTGTPIGEMVRRAARQWLERRGYVSRDRGRQGGRSTRSRR